MPQSSNLGKTSCHTKGAFTQTVIRVKQCHFSNIFKVLGDYLRAYFVVQKFEPALGNIFAVG